MIGPAKAFGSVFQGSIDNGNLTQQEEICRSPTWCLV